MSTYASGTSVSAEASRMEIERTLIRYGATHFMYGSDPAGAVIAFQAFNRRVRFDLRLPRRDDPRFTHYKRGTFTYEYAEAEQIKRWEQACRQKWRALALVVKAKLEAVESGISTFEAEFLANTMLPDGSSFGDWALPQMEEVYKTNEMPPLLMSSNGAVPLIEGPKQ